MASTERNKPKARAHQKSGARPAEPEGAARAGRLRAQPGEREWRERAAFHISLERAGDDAGPAEWQTQAYHEETDSRATWAGLPGQAMIGWIRDKAGLAGAPAPGGLQLRLGELRLDEVLSERQVGQPDTAKRLRAGLDFEICEPAGRGAGARPRCVAQVLAWSPAIGALATLAADWRELRPGGVAYTVALEFDLPAIGEYQLLGLVLLPDDGAAGITLGPMLSVVP